MSKMKYCLLMMGLFGSRAQGMDMGYKEQKSLEMQIKKVNPKEIERQRAVIAHDEISLDGLAPFKEYEKSGNEAYQEIGKRLIKEGKVGCLIVAGGQGSRLNYTKPKGLFPVTLIQKKPLFQLYAEKILAAGHQAGRPLLVAIMTSSENHEETRLSFEENHYFGLGKDQVFFFPQTNLALLDQEGNPFLETKEELAVAPDGNASSLKQFVESGIWDVWHRKGTCYVNYMHIDNALADPFDAELTGFHESSTSSDVIVKCIERENPDEKLGVLFKQKGKVVVVEYSEISEEERKKRNQDGSLTNLCANIGMYSFNMDFIHRVATKYYDELPFHKAWKAVKYLNAQGVTQKSEKPNAWKFEKFIFDVLPCAEHVKAIVYPRSEIFAPLKNAEGDDSLSVVQAALLQRDQKIFEKISGTSVSSKRFELDPAFYYPTLELLKKWEGKTLPETSYVDP